MKVKEIQKNKLMIQQILKQKFKFDKYSIVDDFRLRKLSILSFYYKLWQSMNNLLTNFRSKAIKYRGFHTKIQLFIQNTNNTLNVY